MLIFVPSVFMQWKENKFNVDLFYNVGVAFDLKLGASWNFVGFSGFYSEVRLAGM